MIRINKFADLQFDKNQIWQTRRGQIWLIEIWSVIAAYMNIVTVVRCYRFIKRVMLMLTEEEERGTVWQGHQICLEYLNTKQGG